MVLSAANEAAANMEEEQLSSRRTRRARGVPHLARKLEDCGNTPRPALACRALLRARPAWLVAAPCSRILSPRGAPDRSSTASGQIAERFQAVQNTLNALLARLEVCSEVQLGMKRRLVRVVDTGKLPDLSCERTTVQAFGIARGKHLDGTITEHFEKTPCRGANLVADFAVWADRRHNRTRPATRRYLCDKANASNVRITVSFGEAQTSGERFTHFVAVQALDV